MIKQENGHYFYINKSKGINEEITKELYDFLKSDARQLRYQISKLQKHNVISVDPADLCESNDEDDDEEEGVLDESMPDPEDWMMVADLYERLHRAINMLPSAERELIEAVYFNGISLNKYANSKGMGHTSIMYQRDKILSNLRKLLNKMGSFLFFLTTG